MIALMPIADKEGEGKKGEQPVEVVVPSEVQLEAIAEEVQASWRLKEARAQPSCCNLGFKCGSELFLPPNFHERMKI